MLASASAITGDHTTWKKATLRSSNPQNTTHYYDPDPLTHGGNRTRTLQDAIDGSRESEVLRVAASVDVGDLGYVRGSKSRYEKYKSDTGYAGSSPLLYECFTAIST